MDNPEIRYLGDVQKLALAPSDILVISCTRVVSADEAQWMVDLARRLLPTQNIWVMHDGMKLGVISPESDGP